MFVACMTSEQIFKTLLPKTLTFSFATGKDFLQRIQSLPPKGIFFGVSFMAVSTGMLRLRSQTWRAFLKRPENFSGPKTFRGSFRVNFPGHGKRFSTRPKTPRILTRVFRVVFSGSVAART